MDHWAEACPIKAQVILQQQQQQPSQPSLPPPGPPPQMPPAPAPAPVETALALTELRQASSALEALAVRAGDQVEGGEDPQVRVLWPSLVGFVQSLAFACTILAKV